MTSPEAKIVDLLLLSSNATAEADKSAQAEGRESATHRGSMDEAKGNVMSSIEKREVTEPKVS